MSELIIKQKAFEVLADCYHLKTDIQLEQLKLALDLVPSVSTWVPVTEMLPDSDDMKLVTCQTKKGVRTVNRAYYLNGSWHGSGSMSGVIAWMDLPYPYGGER